MPSSSDEFSAQPSAVSRTSIDFRSRFEALSKSDQLKTICRLVYIEDKDQAEVAGDTGLSQAAVSRALKQARQQRLIRFELVHEPHQADEDRLRYALAMRGVRRVSVVTPDPSPTGKNAGNLSRRAADMLLSLILDPGLAAGTDDNPINIAMACGETLKATVEAFVELLRLDDNRSKEIRTRAINFFPTTLCCGRDYELNDAFPHTLVTSLFLSLYKDFEKMRFFAPTLPLSYYRQEMTEDRANFLVEHKLDRILSAAKNAHIIITGIGTTSSPGFRHAHKVAEEESSHLMLRAEDKTVIPDDLPEICYQPMDDGGDFLLGKYGVVGVTLEELRAAAGHPSDPIGPGISETSSQHVIAVAGGAAKASVIAKALRHRWLPFNTLITDTDVTKALFGDTSVTP